MDSLVRDPVSPRGAPRTIVEPVVGPPVVLPPQAIAAMATAASRAHLLIAFTPRINRLARCKAHLNAAFPYWRPGRCVSQKMSAGSRPVTRGAGPGSRFLALDNLTYAREARLGLSTWHVLEAQGAGIACRAQRHQLTGPIDSPRSGLVAPRHVRNVDMPDQGAGAGEHLAGILIHHDRVVHVIEQSHCRMIDFTNQG